MDVKPVSEVQKFSSDLVWVVISNVVAFLSGLVILLFLTKNYTTEVYGVWVQVKVTVYLLSPILYLQFENACVKFLAGEEDRERRRLTFGVMFWAIVLFCSITVLVALLVKTGLAAFLFANANYFVDLLFRFGS